MMLSEKSKLFVEERNERVCARGWIQRHESRDYFQTETYERITQISHNIKTTFLILCWFPSRQGHKTSGVVLWVGWVGPPWI